MKENKLFIGLCAVLVIIGFFSLIDWGFPRVQRLFDDDAKNGYEEEQRLSSLANAYTLGLKFGEEAAVFYEEEYSKEENIETAALMLFEKKEPSEVYAGPGPDFYTFPDDKYFEKWKGNENGIYTNKFWDAFKSGYIDSFIQYLVNNKN